MFLSTPPSRVATIFSPSVCMLPDVFLSTPPSRVATGRTARPAGASNCFYPRHPRGWRPLEQMGAQYGVNVSIHATLAGGDWCEAAEARHNGMFLSTPPSRVATRTTRAPLQGRFLFLSTPPSRVATQVDIRKAKGDASFYPRHPRGWRRAYVFSYLPRPLVSIHATLAGGDAQGRRPGRTRKVFLSTPPSRVATLGGGNQSEMFSCFYPRHPRGWRRRPPDPADCRDGCFYPRHPRGWRQTGFFRGLGEFVFLSTPPSRVATGYAVGLGEREKVSIHATLAGGDRYFRAATAKLTCFYPRHPRGWRHRAYKQPANRHNSFYPRHPRGWRPRLQTTRKPA